MKLATARATRRFISASLLAGGLVAGATGCATRPLPTTWIGEGSTATQQAGSLPDVIYLDWTLDGTKISGQAEFLKPDSGRTGPPLIEDDATLTGVESDGKLSLTITGTNENGEWHGIATGTITDSKLELNGDALVRYDPYSSNGTSSVIIDFVPSDPHVLEARKKALADSRG